ncbi:hypothetical protein BD779DRAFT_1687495 [Infundibulicybe gibba]|nr:hypothetical protein BD779DRAFT_1687495 [Infundibulicybe gibba]
MVLAHHLTRTTIWLRLARSLCYLSLFSVIHCAFAWQVVLNGQIHTDGLSIIDSPQPNTPIHAGSNLDISVDISGNGKIPPPRSNYPTRFDSLQVYLTSDYANLNLTVSGRSELLDGQTGTVGHFNWLIPHVCRRMAII